MLVGLKHAVTGDTLASASGGAREPAPLEGVAVPAAVFTAAVEPLSPTQQTVLDGALARMVRDDPSLRVTSDDADTGQTLLHGMGELHLEVVADRLRREHGVEMELGRARVAYRETVSLVRALGGDGSGAPFRAVAHAGGSAAGRRGAKASVTVRIVDAAEHERCRSAAGAESDAAEGEGDEDDEDDETPSTAVPTTLARVVLAHASDADTARVLSGEATVETGTSAAAYTSHDDDAGDDARDGALELLSDEQRAALAEGAASAAARGPLGGFALVGGLVVRVLAASASADDGASGVGALRAAAAASVAGAARAADAVLVEPVMRVEVEAPEEALGAVLADLTAQRRAAVRAVDAPASGGGAGAPHRVHADAPLACMLGYSTALRSLTSGAGTIAMEYSHHAAVDAALARQLRATGF